MKSKLDHNISNTGSSILMILDHEFPPDPRVQNEISALITDGYQVHLACFTKKGRPAEEVTPDGLYIHRKHISSFIHKTSVAVLKAPFYFRFWRKFIHSLTSKYKFNAIHIHDLPLASIGVEFSEKLNIPVILDLHENWPFMLRAAKHTNTFLGKILSSNSEWDSYESKMSRKVNAILTVVPEMADRIAKVSGNSENIFVYQNVPDIHTLGSFNLTKNQSGKFQMMYAGGITKPRGIQNIIEALSILKSRNHEIEFTIIGSGAYLPELQFLVKRLDISEVVKFTGWVSQIEVMKQLQNAHLAVIPHLRSTQNDNSSPNKVFQYMLSKTAVLTSNCTSLKRIIDENKCGWVYDYNSPEDPAEKIALALEDRKLTSKLGEAGHQAVNEKYNLEVEKENLLNAYNFLLKKR